MSRNKLAEETSPYLLQHQENPVAWQPWGDDAFEEAQRLGKPVLLSIGYAACHWCHVMAHESFEDPEIAALMNRLFVNIKVDREERPDLDSIYQSALALLGEQGGWPLTMFLTAEGEPFWGGTYFPPEPRYGRPGFAQVLQGLADIYRREPDKVQRNTRALKQALDELSRAPAGEAAITIELLDAQAARLVREVDSLHGGVGRAPKFPQVPILKLLWRAWRRTGQEPYRRAVTLTLTRMSQGGIYDHLGGGFARYSVDERWLVPHFEKMLYDNAQLIEILSLVWQETRDPLYEARLRETVAWTLREMLAAESAAPGSPACGAFASTLDADSEGEEGRFYVWTEAEIEALLGTEATLFKQAYDVTPGGNWEGRTILNRSQDPELRAPGIEARLAALRARLLEARGARVRPGWDDKVLADWNGLMIAALADAAAVFAEPGWLAAARRAFDFVRERMVEDGRLRHSWRHGLLKHPATLEDYAALCRASLALHEASGDPALIDQTTAWIDTLDAHYLDPDDGAYFLTADDTRRLLVRTKTAFDNAVPAGNGLLAGVFARLYHLTGDDDWRLRADRLIQAFAGHLERNAFPLATLLEASELLQRAVQVVIVGEPAAEDTRALAAAAVRAGDPNRVLQVVSSGELLRPAHPAHGRTGIDHRATAYVCRGTICSLPITEPEQLREALGG